MLRSLLLPVLFIAGFFSAAQAAPPVRTITIVVDQHQGIIMGRDTVDTETLPKILSERLWKSYLSTGRMYDSIKVQIRGEVLMGTRGAVLDAIREGQLLALKKLCLHKYQKRYDALTPAQQQRVRIRHGVLFQETFS